MQIFPIKVNEISLGIMDYMLISDNLTDFYIILRTLFINLISKDKKIKTFKYNIIIICN